MFESHPVPPHHWPVRVYYEDTDAAGVVYYANYLKFCERARTEWLRALGFEQQRLRDERGLVFVVHSLSADYLRSAELDDALVVESRVLEAGRAKLVFGQKILRGAQALFESKITVVCVNLSKKKPASLPDDLRALLEPLK
ncbi:MAG: tol-pal system-associated acyl-CoA thioesterase [Betaproteobacteria bacterium]|nr:tol-pal system-associated acyl-CoA thioesterase [Betaproteobacteria bacterium]